MRKAYIGLVIIIPLITILFAVFLPLEKEEPSPRLFTPYLQDYDFQSSNYQPNNDFACYYIQKIGKKAQPDFSNHIQQVLQQFDQYVKYTFPKTNIPGAALVVVYRGNIVM